jgi:hypothetical protein
MIANSRCLNLTKAKEVVHDLARADELGRLDTALKLVACIHVEIVIRVL